MGRETRQRTVAGPGEPFRSDRGPARAALRRGGPGEGEADVRRRLRLVPRTHRPRRRGPGAVRREGVPDAAARPDARRLQGEPGPGEPVPEDRRGDAGDADADERLGLRPGRLGPGPLRALPVERRAAGEGRDEEVHPHSAACRGPPGSSRQLAVESGHAREPSPHAPLVAVRSAGRADGAGPARRQGGRHSPELGRRHLRPHGDPGAGFPRCGGGRALPDARSALLRHGSEGAVRQHMDVEVGAAGRPRARLPGLGQGLSEHRHRLLPELDALGARAADPRRSDPGVGPDVRHRLGRREHRLRSDAPERGGGPARAGVRDPHGAPVCRRRLEREGDLRNRHLPGDLPAGPEDRGNRRGPPGAGGRRADRLRRVERQRGRSRRQEVRDHLAGAEA